MPAVKIHADHKGRQILVRPDVGLKSRFYTCLDTRTVAVPAVDDPPVPVQPDLLAQPVHGREIDFRLKVIGEPDFSMDGVEVDAQEWSEPTEVEDLQEIDIGLYPLPDEEWVLGKSGLKALQYMALGIPTVATRVGANNRIIQDGENGFLVSDREEWQRRILELASDADLRRRIGDRAKRTVSERFSVSANREAYLEVLDAVFGERESPGDAAPGDRAAAR